MLQASIVLIIENGFTLKKRSKRYPAKTMTDAVYADDLALLTNTLALTESLLHNREQAARGVGLYLNSNITELIHFKQKGSHIHFKWQASKISRQVHIPR